MTILNTCPAVAQCDGCGAEGEPDEQRGPKTGALTWAFLPIGWLTVFYGAVQVHLCTDCVAAHPEPFGDRRQAFTDRLDRLGLGHLDDIVICCGIPAALGAQWAAEWQRAARSVS